MMSVIKIYVLRICWNTSYSGVFIRRGEKTKEEEEAMLVVMAHLPAARRPRAVASTWPP